MRNIVEHGQISGSSDTTVLSGCSAARRCTRWISVPTAMAEPGGRGLDRLDDAVGRADLVGELARPRARTRGGRSRSPSGCSARNAATCSGRNRWCTEQWPFHSRNVASLHVALVEPAELEARVPHPHVVVAVAHGEAGVAAEVLVGEEQHLVAPRRAPTRGPPGRWTTCTPRRRGRRRTPSARPRVHVGDRHEPLDVGDVGRAPPTPPRPGRCRPCRPSSSRR